jgi:hypothetical protein
MKYLDIPSFHQFNEEGNAFFTELSQVTDDEIEIFNKKSV